VNDLELVIFLGKQREENGNPTFYPLGK